MTAEHLCSAAWLFQWQKLYPVSDNMGCIADLSILWLSNRVRANRPELQCKTIWDSLTTVFLVVNFLTYLITRISCVPLCNIHYDRHNVHVFYEFQNIPYD